VRERVARSRRLVARGRRGAVVARVMQISRQAIYRTPKQRPAATRRPATGTVGRAIVEMARANPTDGTRMVAALTSRELERPISRKRAQRVMRAEGLLQRHRPSGRRRRPGYFRVERPDQLWHMDMTSVWVAEHGWCYLNAIVDCCTCEIPGLGLDLRCRRQEAEAVVTFPALRTARSRLTAPWRDREPHLHVQAMNLASKHGSETLGTA
jgi:putative transposase